MSLLLKLLIALAVIVLLTFPLTWLALGIYVHAHLCDILKEDT